MYHNLLLIIKLNSQGGTPNNVRLRAQTDPHHPESDKKESRLLYILFRANDIAVSKTPPIMYFILTPHPLFYFWYILRPPLGTFCAHP